MKGDEGVQGDMGGDEGGMGEGGVGDEGV